MEPSTKQSDTNPIIGVIVVVIVIAAVIGVIKLFTNPAPTSTAMYDAKITSQQVTDNKTVTASAIVKNIGTSNTMPRCVITAVTAAGERGYDTFDKGSALTPGQEWKFTGQVTIPSQDAANTTSVTVSCK